MPDSKRVYGTHELECLKNGTGHAVVLRGKRASLAEIVPDAKYPGMMWRVREADGTLSDMVNLSRAKDAALNRALSVLNGRAKGATAGLS